MAEKRILDGLLVIDFSTTVTGPASAMVLGNYGATVVKVESVIHPDSLRLSPPFKDGQKGVNRSGYFCNYNGSKLSIALNMNMPQGVALARKLCERADIIIEAYRPGVVGKWGLSYEELSKVNPRLIMVSSNMLGQYGPHCGFVGYGVQGQGLSGWAVNIGFPDRTPTGPFGAYTDSISARFVAIAILAALEYRRRTGKGQYIDHSQVECSVAFQAPLILDYSANRRLTGRNGNRDPYAAPHGAFRCAGDDRWCAIAVTSDREWADFCRVIGNPAWTRDARFATQFDRKKNEGELERLVETWTGNHDADEVAEMMQAGGVGALVVENSADMFRDPQLQHRKHFTVLNQTEIGPHAYENFGFRLSRVPGAPRMAAPNLGEHTEQVCKEIIGLSDEEFVQLLADGVFQ